MSDSVDPLLTVKSVGQMLGLTPRHVYVLVQHKAIPFVKIGGAVRFKRAALEAWINSKSVRVSA